MPGLLVISSHIFSISLRITNYCFILSQFTSYLTNLLEHTLDVLGIVADAPRHEVDIQGWTRLKAIVGIEQRAAFQNEPILVFTDGKSIQQTFLEVTREKQLRTIVLISRYIEQTLLNRLAMVFDTLCHIRSYI